MDWDEKKEAVRTWLGDDWKKTAIELQGSMYTFSEMGLFHDFDGSIDSDLAIQIWAIVEKCRTQGFPEELEM